MCRTWAGGSCPCDTLFNAGGRAWFHSACSCTTGFAEGASLLAMQGPLEHGFRIGTEDYCCPGGFPLPAVCPVIPAPVQINTVCWRNLLDFWNCLSHKLAMLTQTTQGVKLTFQDFFFGLVLILAMQTDVTSPTLSYQLNLAGLTFKSLNSSISESNTAFWFSKLF